MNLSFIIGAAVCFLTMFLAIIFDGAAGTITVSKVMSFLDLQSFLIVVVGTMTALFASFPIRDFMKLFQQLPIILGAQKNDPVYYINVMTDLSQQARKKGLLALEDQASQFEDPFLRSSVMLIVDAMEPDKVREQLDNELGNIEQRHAACWTIYEKGAAYAPAFGMCGTMIGLINMLKEMNFEEEGGASSLAQNMSVALITTFYGSLLANAIFLPAVSQLRTAHSEEMLCKEIIIEGIISIQAGENPRHINEKLMSFLTQKQRAAITTTIES